MDLNRLCPGCMQEIAESDKMGFCPHCGFQFQTVNENQAHRLKPYTVLHEKYVIGKVLGEGGFGITYLGYDLTLEMKIAIKEYYPAGYVTREIANGNTVTTFTGSREEFYLKGKEKFIHEARTLAKFATLPGIVSVRDFFEENNTSYIIMELLEGETLKGYLKKMGGRIPVNTVLAMMQPVVQSLEEVHKQGLIHRDISPENIMILNNGTMKLLDFGAAREVSGEEADKSLSVILKPGYAPEEQYRTHGKQGPWTDLYAICGTIYKCLTGSTPPEAMERMRQDTLVPPSYMGVMLQPWQEAALMKGLAVYAEDRYHSLEDFYQAFYLNMQPMMNDNNDGRTVAMPGGMPNQFFGQPQPAPGMMNGQPMNTMNGQPMNTMNGQPVNTMNGQPVNTMNGQPMNTLNGQPVPPPYGANYAGPQYAFSGMTPQQMEQQKKNKKKLALIIAAIAVILCVIIGIIIAAVLDSQDKETSRHEKVETTPTAEVTEEPEAEVTAVPPTGNVISSEGSQVIRGNGIGALYQGYFLMKTAYGIGMAAPQGDGTYGDFSWLASLNSGIEIHAMAVYGDYLYMACGNSGLVRTNLLTGDDLPVIVQDNVYSFAVAANKLYYIVLEGEYDSTGTLYSCELDGSSQTEIAANVSYSSQESGNTDLEYDGTYLYFFAQNADYSQALNRLDVADGSIEELATEDEYDYHTASGLYLYGDQLYTNTYSGIYAYDIAADAVEQVLEGDMSTYFPLVFVDGNIFYVDGDWNWQVYSDGSTSEYNSGLNNGYLYMDTIEGQLFYFADYDTYYSVDYADGAVVSENEIEMGYYDTPDLDTVISSSDNAGADYRASFTGYYDGNYVLLKNLQWANTLVYSDSTESFTLSNDNIRYFTVIGNEAYYTKYDSDTEIYSLWKRLLTADAEEEQLLDGTQVNSFSYYDGLIYYDNYDDYYELYCYDPETGSNTKIGSDSFNYYYLLNGYVYYECLDDGTICKMALDGTDKNVLFNVSDYDAENFKSITAFGVDGSTFLSFITDGGNMYVTTEDGTSYELIAEGLEEFDLYQDMYYADGSLYYSAANGTEIHKMDIAEYLETDVETIPDTVICSQSFVYFEVSGGLVYVELYDGDNDIIVIDYQTGEQYNSFNFKE